MTTEGTGVDAPWLGPQNRRSVAHRVETSKRKRNESVEMMMVLCRNSSDNSASNRPSDLVLYFFWCRFLSRWNRASWGLVVRDMGVGRSLSETPRRGSELNRGDETSRRQSQLMSRWGNKKKGMGSAINRVGTYLRLQLTTGYTARTRTPPLVVVLE